MSIKITIAFSSLFNGCGFMVAASRISVFALLSILFMCLPVTVSSAPIEASQGVNSSKSRAFNAAALNGYSIEQPLVLKSIAILPFENLTRVPVAPTIVMDYVKKELKGKGWVLITRDEIVEKFLAKRRIRYTGAITRLTVREMGKVLGVDAVMVGSVNQYSSVGKKIVVGMSCRLVSTIDGSLIWADNLTYTGNDFVGLLGLGTVRSLEVLSSMVVKDLVKGIADRFFIRDTALSPFEIERVLTYPTIGRAGERIDLRVMVLPIVDAPKQVRAVLAGSEIVLEKVSDTEYKGVMVAPKNEGTYLLDIIATDSMMVPFSFEAVGKVVVDSTPPSVNLVMKNKVFSTSKGGKMELDARLMSIDEVDEWKLFIYNSEGKIVKSDRGYGMLPKKLVWRGNSDTSKTYVEDGKYTYEFIIKDVAGNETTLTDKIMLKNTPPNIDVNIEVVEDLIIFSFSYDLDDMISSWALEVIDREGNVLKRMAGEGTLPDKLEYQVTDELDFSHLAFSLTVKDEAGNEMAMTKTMPAYFAGRAPFAELRGEKGRALMEDF
jgi:TolB-like protein